MTQWNKSFTVDEMNGSNNFQLVIASTAPDTIDECIDSNTKLNSNVGGVVSVPCALKWENDSITLANPVTFDIGDTTKKLKAIFLRHKNGYVLGYSINNNAFSITNELVFGGGILFWSFSEGNING